MSLDDFPPAPVTPPSPWHIAGLAVVAYLAGAATAFVWTWRNL